MLPIARQVLAKTHPNADIIALSACIITEQLVMIGVAAAVGWAMRRGVVRKTIVLVAFVTLPIRGFLFTLTDSPFGVVGIQLLDGVAAGIFGVISIIIAADLMRGTGRFNLAQGLVALSTGLGAGGEQSPFRVCGTDFRLHHRFYDLSSDCSGRARLFRFVDARNPA